MEIMRSHWLPWNSHCSSHKLVSVPYKVTLRNLEKTTFISCSLQNNATSLRLAENPSEKSTYSRGLLTTKSVMDVSKVNRIIKECTEDGFFEDAIRVYLDFIECGFPVEEFRFFPCLIKAFGGLHDVNKGKQIHGHLLKFGFLQDIFVKNSLLGMYWKCGAAEDAVEMFERMEKIDSVSWNTMISGFCQSGEYVKSLVMFRRMITECGGSYHNRVACLGALSSCASIKCSIHGLEIHGFLVKNGLDSDEFLVSGLIEMYMKCGDIKNAENVFERIRDNELVGRNMVVFHGLSTRDLVSWNALISGFAQNKCADEALKAFRDMQSKKIKPNTVTMACILSVCTHLSVMILCKEVHCYLLRHWFETNALVNNSLISAYAKCGDIRSSWTVFEKLPVRNEVAWNSILLGFGMHGCTDEMFATFEKMKKTNIKPDHGTFTSLLSTCSHSGKVDAGWKYFISMMEDYNLEPRVEQYTCMVDLLGRAGYLNQAYDLIMSMPCSPDDRIWGSLLASCKNHGNTKLAEVAANHIFELDPSSVGYRVLLTNLYEDSGNLNEVFRVRTEMKQMGLKKQPGCSWIEVSNSMHIFVAGDYSHAQSEDIYATIESLSLEMKRVGYVPHIQAASNKYWA
ncbi:TETRATRICOPEPTIDE REPEAT-LIKE SUPERFAMILY PROTEIN [Salix purpurea]|uniref:TETRATRICOPEPTIDE REPEAT-LIKE SUPERFAMILY PROTEIN n=1 Tax=Salix purpurea TaxID=77065 RepID=A0A9Q0ZVM1_SALPP|nr:TETRATRICOPEPTIDE REPEAT-LIKE SUPERFAMILY PROTEIN [Salix purpurea]